MENKIVKLDDSELDNVSGGSIVFNEDCTTCGRNCNDQYRVVDFNSVIAYINANMYNMTEKTMLANMVAMGYLQNL